MENFDFAVIGGGPAGYNGALHAAEKGLSVVLVERDELGGTCLNRGCIPTKTLLKSAEIYDEVTHAEAFGVTATATFDQERIYARKNAVVDRLKGGIALLLKKANVTVIRGTASFESAHVLSVQTEDGVRQITARGIMLATGSAPARLPFAGSELTLTSDEVLSAPQDASSIVVVGGGVIGMEFACYFSALGKTVTVVEYMPKILPPADRDASQALASALKRRGVKILTSSSVQGVQKLPDGTLSVAVESRGKLDGITCDCVVVGVGRIAQFASLHLENAGVNFGKRIEVDENFQTNVPCVYAVGDVSSPVQLAHLAEAQALSAVEHFCSAATTTDLSVVPSCVYTTPEVAWVGRTEGDDLAVGKFFMAATGKAVVEDATGGFVKLAFDPKTHALLGATLVCPHATDMIAELALALAKHLTAEDLASVIHPHPTISEAVRLAALAVKF